MQLDARLQAVADFVPTGSCIADIGTDHAYLAAVLVRTGRAVKAVACDKNAGPCEAARKTIEENDLGDKVTVRQGDGLAPLAPKEVDTACIAGMGGGLIIEILSASPAVLQGLHRLVLQPMNAAFELRQWLYAHGWHLAEEALAQADGRIYEVLAAEPGQQERPADWLLQIGPLLWQKKPMLLHEQLRHILQRQRRAVSGMEQSEAARKSLRYLQLKQQLQELEEKAKW